MSIKKYIKVFVLLFLVGCKTLIEPGGELINTDLQIIEQDGKSLWLIYRDSTENNFDISGVHKIKYSQYNYISKSKQVVDFYNLEGYLIDTNSIYKYCKVIYIFKKGNLIEESYYDNNNNLIKPEFFQYSRIKRKYYKDKTWVEKYYDSNNKPISVNNSYEQHKKWDTIWQINNFDTVGFQLQIKTINQKPSTK